MYAVTDVAMCGTGVANLGGEVVKILYHIWNLVQWSVITVTNDSAL